MKIGEIEDIKLWNTKKGVIQSLAKKGRINALEEKNRKKAEKISALFPNKTEKS